MKRFTSLMLMLLCTVTAWAQELVQITTDTSNPIYYTIYNTRSQEPGGFMYYAGDAVGIKDGCNSAVLEDKYKFYFTGSDNALYIHNAATTNKLATVGSWTTEGTVWCVKQREDGNLAFGPQGATDDEKYWWNDKNYATDAAVSDFTVWTSYDAGSGFVVEPASEFTYPEVGKFYTIEAPLFEKVQGVAKGLVANGGNSLGWNTVDLANKNYYWTLVKDDETNALYLKNVGTGYYINGDAVSEDAAALTTNALGSDQFNIVTNNVKLHANGHSNGNGASGGVLSWNGAANSASAWKFVERKDPDAVETLDITYNFTYKGVNKGTQTKTVLVGEEYPDIEISFPFGITATKPDGNVAENSETTFTIVLEENLPFDCYSSYDAIENWYYVKLKGTNYLYHVKDQDYIALDQTAVAADNKDAFSWAFVGDPFNGFQFVNKAAGQGYVLSSTTTTTDGNTGGNTHPVMTATPVVEGNNELWVLTASTYQANGFYMAQKGFASNRMNNRDGKLAYWNGGADNGSTFTVELRLTAKAELIALAAQAEALLAQITIGEAIGQYSSNYEGYAAAYAEIAAYVEGGEIEEAVAEEYVATLSAIMNSFSVNGLVAGKYYTFSNGGYYITSGVTEGGRIACSETKDATAIYYFDGEHLLAYSTGLYFGLNANDWTFEAVGSTDISKITFAAVNGGTANVLNICSGGRWLHRTDAYINRCSNNTCDELHEWTIEEVTSLPVSITAAGYATFFAPVAVTVAEGVKAYTVTVDGDVAKLNEIGATIPANTGVVLAGAEDAYDFAITTAAAFEGTNLMAGTIAKTLVTKPENTECYVLANGENGVGMYVAKNGENTAEFLNAGHKAYLAVAGSANIASYSFRFEDGTTAIENVEVENAVKAIYDLTGRRVEAITAPGIYVVNGKKVLVK